jgi:hypothetical protein
MRRIIYSIKYLAALVIVVSSSLVSTASVFASPNEATLQSYGFSRYDPNFTECGAVDNTANSAPTFTITDNPTIKSIFMALTAGGMNSVQAAAVMGNMYRESKFNSDAHEAGNDIGYGLAQWSFDRRARLEAFTKSKGVATSDVPTQLAFLFTEYNTTYKASLIGTSFENATDVTKATEAWMHIYETPGPTPANDPAALNSERIPAAIQVYALYKDIGPAPSLAAVNTTDCGSGNGIVAGNIVKTALGLALQSPATSYNYPESSPTGPGTDESTARDTYRVAKKQYNPTVAFSDCGGFIATVMVASGADKSYPLVSVSVQVAYVRAHPDKYTIIEHPINSDLQPGDILLSNSEGHTTMYIGPTVINNVTYTDVDASLGQRVPSVRDSSNHTWMVSHNAIVARIKK